MANALQVGTLFRGSPYEITKMFQLCGNASMSVLGTTNMKFNARNFDPSSLSVYLGPQSRFPQLFCPRKCNISVQIVLYRRPSPMKMQYLSLNPIPLVLGDKSLDSRSRSESYDAHATELRLIQKLRLHTVIERIPSAKELLLPTIITQANCSAELAQLMLRNISLIGVRQRRKLSVSERVVESASTIWDLVLSLIWHFFTVWIYPVIIGIFKVGLITHRMIAEIVLRALEWRLRTESAALKDISATAQQVDIRLQQFCYWPIQYTTLRKRKDDWCSVTDSHPEYIRFYNSLWLVANDVIIGIAVGTFIIENANGVASALNDFLSHWTVNGLTRMIDWLTDWPAGLKLNNELAQFLGNLVLWVIDYWSCMFRLSDNDIWLKVLVLLDGIKPILPHMVYFIGYSSFAGATMPIALFSDLLSLLTMHIYCFYVAAARIYHWQLTIIISLFHLFRGKKHNVLRDRIDSCDYDLDQLLLGTILFTLLSFLLPTVLVFYVTFALSRMAIISLKAISDTLLSLLNHFPLFALMLRIKDPQRLPRKPLLFPILDSLLRNCRWNLFRTAGWSTRLILIT